MTEHEREPWESEPKDYMEVVYGPGYWVTDRDVQQDIGPEFLMYWNQHVGFEEPQQRFP